MDRVAPAPHGIRNPKNLEVRLIKKIQASRHFFSGSIHFHLEGPIWGLTLGLSRGLTPSIHQACDFRSHAKQASLGLRGRLKSGHEGSREFCQTTHPSVAEGRS